MWLLEKSADDFMASHFGLALDKGDPLELWSSAGMESARNGGTPAVDGVIPINGVLTNAPDWMAMMFGGGNTLYPDIIKAVAQADADPNVKQITLRVGSSPGGNFEGLVPAMEAIRKTKTPVVAIVDLMAASATYGIVAQADKIIATSKGTLLGSVGAKTTRRTDENVVEIASTKAPKKAPDPTTEEGLAIIREGLDSVHALYAGMVAKGRGVSTKTVDSTFGEGAVVLAGDALKANMIDAIGVTKKTAAVQGAVVNKEGQSMDLKQLQAEHPGIYNTAVQAGVDKERDRVAAHMKLGEQSGDMKTTAAAIESGSGLTDLIVATHAAAHMAKVETKNRVADNVDVGDGDLKVKGGGGGDSLEAQTMAIFNSRNGGE